MQVFELLSNWCSRGESGGSHSAGAGSGRGTALQQFR